PGFAIIVSLDTQILPCSILVGTFDSLNSDNTGPGVMPVFPAGIVISFVAISPPFADRNTLFSFKIKFNLNALILVNINAHWPSNSLLIFSKLLTSVTLSNAL